MSQLSDNVHHLEKALSSNNIPEASSLLDSVYSKICGDLSDSNGIYYIPGINFSYVSPEASPELFASLFSAIISSKQFLSEFPELASNVICQIAAYDFSYFVDNYFPKLMEENDTIRRILALVSRKIVDPIQGFLLNAPRSPKNDSWNDESHCFDFFSEESPEFETEFGKSLTKMREQLYSLYVKITKSHLLKFKGSSIRETIFVPSFTTMIQTVIVPPSYRMHNISCGYPTRLEALYAISQFQDYECFSKSKPDHFNHEKLIAKQYSDLNSHISGFPSNFSDDYVKFSEPYTFSNDLEILICKLLPLLNINTESEESAPITQLIISLDGKYAAFYLSLAQLFYLAYPSFTFSAFDDVILQCETSLANYSPEQNHTLYHMLTRIIDVLACLPQRYIEDEMIEKLNALGLLGLGSSLPRIRYSAYKLIETLGHFEAGDEKVPLSQILHDNSGFFEEHLLHHFEKDPMILMSRNVMTPMMPLPMLDAMTSTDCNIWQYMYSAIGIFAAQNFSESLLTNYKQMAISYIIQSRINRDARIKSRLVNTLTFLSAVAETPLSNFGEKSTIPIVQKLTNQILNELFQVVFEYIDTSYPIIRVLLSPLNISSFPAFLKMMDDSVSQDIIALVLRSMAWNINFSAISEHEEFFSIFLDLFIKNFFSFDWGDLKEEIIPTITNDHMRKVSNNWIFLSECLMTGFKLFSALYVQRKAHVVAPFPCCDFVVDTQSEFIIKIQPMMCCLFNLARIPTTQIRLQTYAIATLTQWCACCTIEDINFLCSDIFYELLKSLTQKSTKNTELLLHLLSHHFDILFGQYLQWAMLPGGSGFFEAIARFFRASSLTTNIMLSDIIKTQWLSCSDIDQSSPFLKHLQIIYENCGSLLLCCLFYMNFTDFRMNEPAFITLSSLVPVIALFHMSGRPDDITKLFEMFLEISRRLEQNTRCLDKQTILNMSQNLCPTFSFCMEALLYAALEFLPKNSQEIVDHTLFTLMPWFDSIEFDLENRVISNQTELLFLHFSCYSFIDKLMTSFKDYSNLDVNSSFFDIWRTMISVDNCIGPNFLSIELSIIYDCQNSANHSTALPIMRYLYRVAPHEIVSILCSYLSLNKFFYDNIHATSEAVNDLSHVLGDEFIEPTDKNDLYQFIYQALGKLVLDSYHPFIPYVPLIFASCLIFIDRFFDVIIELLINVLDSFKTLVSKDMSHMLLEAIQTVAGLSNAHRHMIDRSELTRNLTNFLLCYDQQMALEFGHELLKWGLCCGDLKNATAALQCYTGNLIDTSMLVIGLISRSMWTVSDAIPILISLNENVSDYTDFLATSLTTFSAMAPNKCTPVDHVVLWLALASLNRNTPIFAGVFNSALSLLTIFLTPQNFIALSEKEKLALGAFPVSTFWRFHQPWGDVYHGALKPILEFTGDGNVELMIAVINKLLQIQYLPLLSDSPCGVYTGLLALLPWMWYVATTEISRFLFDSADVQDMELTVNSIEPFVDNKDIVALLSNVYMGEDVDTSVVLDTVADLVIPLVDEQGIAQISHFYATCAKCTEKNYKIPIYSIAAKILKHSANKEKTASALSELTDIIQGDSKNSRVLYVNMYLKQLPNQKISRPLFDFNVKLNDSNDNNQVVDENYYYVNDPINIIKNLTESQTDDQEKEPYPEIPMYERIVAMNIPHLYDVNVNEVQVANFDDLNSFPPLLPNNPKLLASERFLSLFNLFQKFKCEPFSTYSEMLNKLHTSLVDVDALNVMKLCEKISFFPVNRVFSDTLKEFDMSNVQQRDVEEEEIFEQVEEIQDEFLTQTTDPYEFILISPNAFVPSFEMMNSIGLDLVEGMEAI